MLQQILAIIMLGITIIAEVFMVHVESIQYLYGVHFFIDLSIMIALPVITIYLFIKAFYKKPQIASQIEKLEAQEAAEEDILENYPKMFSATIKTLIPLNGPWKTQLNRTAEQISRFEKKIALAKELVEKTDAASTGECLDLLKASKKIFYGRLEKLVSLCEVFDEDEYRKFINNELHFPDENRRREKAEYFEELRAGSTDIADRNEELILSVDKVIQTLAESAHRSEWDASALISIQELEQLVEKNKGSIQADKKINQEVAAEWGAMARSGGFGK